MGARFPPPSPPRPLLEVEPARSPHAPRRRVIHLVLDVLEVAAHVHRRT